MLTFQEMLRRLALFWENQGCIIHQGYDLEAGAGTFNPATFLRCLGPEPYRAAYIEPCRRPSDGRYGTNPNRMQHYFQYQVILKPSPENVQELYLQSLEAAGLDLSKHDIRFVHDDWENPTIGAWGLGWEVWMDGMEVTQFTYFQSVGGVSLKPITAEITYGLERLAQYIQNVNSVFDLKWNDQLTYGDIYHRNEVEWSHYNFEEANTEMWHRHFEDYEREAKKLLAKGLPIPGYDFIMKASHAFNMLDARGVISVTERTGYIHRIRDLARLVAESYQKSREELAHPLLGRFAIKEPSAPESASINQALIHAGPTQKEDYLLEIGSEELPATFVPIGCRNLEKGVKQLLDGEGIAYEKIEVFGTPRRLALIVRGLSLGKAKEVQEKRGPMVSQAYSAGQLTRPGEGFFKSVGITPPKYEDLQRTPQVAIKDDYLYVKVEKPGRATAEVLSENLPKIILNLEFPKKMRWANLDITYARPIRWLLSLFGSHVVPFTVGNIHADRRSFGHRQMDPEKFPIAHASEYVKTLKSHKVMCDIQERKSAILAQLDNLEKETGASIIERERVLAQVLHLVEWPQAAVALFDPAFLRIPKEVLISEMVEHQKYFPIVQKDGSLKNQFVIVCNVTPTDEIKRGNQKVLSARLSDGVFLYEQDLKVPLEAFNDKLRNVTFQKELGSVYDKVERIINNVDVLQRALGISDPERARRAAEICKADLASGMVYEFPDLQGIIGRYYALAKGEDPEVAGAIDEHWMPRGEHAPLPASETGILVSLADKLDNLICCFSIGLKPTSSSDPYALRRQVLGIIKMLIQGKYRLPMMQVIENCLSHYPLAIVQDQKQLLADLQNFFINRIKSVFQDYELSHDEVEASLNNGFTDIYDSFCSVQALHRFRQKGDRFPLLYEVYKRAKGQISEHKSLPFSTALLKESAEKDLDSCLVTTQESLRSALASHDYDRAYLLIAELQPKLATLFDQVRILADEPEIRTNRIALLQRVFALFGKLLDFSKISPK